MESTWQNRDLPVLRAMVEFFDDPERSKLGLDELQKRTGLSDDAVKRAARALNDANPPLIKAVGVDQVTYPIAILGVTERARVLAGQWPRPEQLVDELVAALNEAADDAEDADEKSRLRSVAATIGGVARDVVVRTATAWASEGLGPAG